MNHAPSRPLQAPILIATREVAAAFDSGTAWVYAIAFTVLTNAIFMNEFFLVGTADMRPWFDSLPMLLAIFLPAVTMRTWAEERKHRTIEFLLTLPITTAQATVGKFLSTLVLLGLLMTGAVPIIVMLYALGQPDGGAIVAGLVGACGLGAVFLAIGVWLSAIATDQLVAFTATSVFCMALVLTGEPRVVAVVDGLWPGFAVGTWVADHISILSHYRAATSGRLTLGALTYAITACTLALVASARAVGRSRR